jgi:hypothetical protein
MGEQIAAWQPGRAGKEVNTTTHAFTNTFFLWDGKELLSKSLPMEELFAYHDARKMLSSIDSLDF